MCKSKCTEEVMEHRCHMKMSSVSGPAALSTSNVTTLSLLLERHLSGLVPTLKLERLYSSPDMSFRLYSLCERGTKYSTHLSVELAGPAERRTGAFLENADSPSWCDLRRGKLLNLRGRLFSKLNFTCCFLSCIAGAASTGSLGQELGSSTTPKLWTVALLVFAEHTAVRPLNETVKRSLMRLKHMATTAMPMKM